LSRFLADLRDLGNTRELIPFKHPALRLTLPCPKCGKEDRVLQLRYEHLRMNGWMPMKTMLLDREPVAAQDGPGHGVIAVLTLAFATVKRAIPGVRLGPQGRPHFAHPHRAAREPREQRLSVLLCAERAASRRVMRAHAAWSSDPGRQADPLPLALLTSCRRRR
jgi:hypothetical protein